jgi:predicted SAM-dependent methyltransferase
MRLNIGCGKKRLPGYTGVDMAAREGVDIVAPADRIPLPDGVADEVLAIHLLEHVFAWEAPALLREWHRLLKRGGQLTLEMPDLMKACRNLAEDRKVGKHPDQGHIWAIYGDDTLRDPLMMHKTGWWFDRLKPVVEAAGFVDVVERETVFHPVGRGVRDFRLEACKA